MKKQMLLYTGLLAMSLCACGTGAATEEVATTEQPTIEAETTATPEPTEESDFEEETAEEEDYSLKSTSPKYEAYVENYGKVNIQFTNLETNQIETIEAVDELEMGNCIEEIYWISDTVLAVEEHINPSTRALVVIDAEKNSILYSKYGLDFAWTDEDPNSLLYKEPKPHFSSVSGYERIYNIEEKELLETGDGEEIKFFGISKTDYTIAYVVRDKNEKDTVYIADYNKKKKELITKDMIKIDKHPDYYEWNEDGQFVGIEDEKEKVIVGGKI